MPLSCSYRPIPFCYSDRLLFRPICSTTADQLSYCYCYCYCCSDQLFYCCYLTIPFHRSDYSATTISTNCHRPTAIDRLPLTVLTLLLLLLFCRPTATARSTIPRVPLLPRVLLLKVLLPDILLLTTRTKLFYRLFCFILLR